MEHPQQKVYKDLIMFGEAGYYPIQFLESPVKGYKERTVENAKADCTIAIAADFTSAGEILTKKSVLKNKKLYCDIDISRVLEVPKGLVDLTVASFNRHNIKTLNLAGNSIATLRNQYSQQQLDYFTYTLLREIVTHPNLQNKITHIRSGGQTGIDEAGVKAGYLLGIPTTILAPKGWTFRDAVYMDISDERKFKARFDKVQSWDKLNWDKFNEEVQKYIV